MKIFVACAAALTLAACSPGGEDAAGAGGSVAATGFSTGATSGVATVSAGTGSTGTGSPIGATSSGTSTTTAGATHGTSTTTGGATTSGASTGGSTGGGFCESEFQPCSTSAACACGLICVVDPAFTSAFGGGAESVCERPCKSAADCPNAASYCTLLPPVLADAGPNTGFDGGLDAGTDGGSDGGFDAGVDAGPDAGADGGGDAGPGPGPDAGSDAGADAGPGAAPDAGTDAGLRTDGGADAGYDAGPGGSCAILQCAMGAAGDACPVDIVVADAGTVAVGVGTCIPQSDIQPNGSSTILLCLPPGDATSCDMSSDENPLLSGGSSFFGVGSSLNVANPQPRDPSSLCAQGGGCVDGGCATLCVPTVTTCDAGGSIVCVSQDPNDTSWGFCLPCGSSGSDGGKASSCVLDSDCCEQNCGQGSGFSITGQCAPAGQQ